MFGYIKPFKPHLRFCEFDAYRAVYCGLCGQMGRSYGPLARLTLSYDFAFYGMLAYALSEQEPVISLGRCHVNPLKRVPLAAGDEILQRAADLASIMIYYKMLDNIRDGGFLARMGWSLLRPVLARARRKAGAACPGADAAVARAMEEQAALEREGCRSVDAACEPTARAMAYLCAQLSEEPDKQRVLDRLGYLIGRYVYLCDALDDLPEDLRRGSYNPYASRHGLEKGAPAEEIQRVRDQARQSLYLTVAEAGNAFVLLDVQRFEPVLENILLQGLRAEVDQILRAQHQDGGPESADHFPGGPATEKENP